MTSTSPRPRLWAIFAAAGLAAGVMLAPSADGLAEAATEPTFSVIVKSGTVQFHDWPPGGSIDVKIDDAPFGPYTFEDCQHGCDGLPVGIGSYVVVSDGTTTKDHTVTNLTITAVDEAANTVTGSADPGEVIDVWHHGDGSTLQATANASGAWTADFTGQVDFGPGTDGNSSETDSDGDQTWAFWRVPNPVIQVGPATGSIWVNEFLPNESITITIDGNPAGTHITDEWGNFDGNNFGLTFDVAEGSYVVVSDGTTTKDHTVTNLTITAVDEAANTVTGSADPGEVIDVWHHGDGSTLQATANASGAWTADFTGQVDFGPGTDGNSSETDSDGDQTWAFWRVFDPWIGASVTHEEVWANDFPDEPAGQTLYYRLDDPATPGIDFEYDMPLIVNHGQTEAGDRSFGRYDVQAGQTFTVRNRPFTNALGDGVEKVLELSRIEVTGVDGDADIITGYADSTEGPDICVWSQDTQLCNGDAGFMWAGEDWTADFGSVGSDVKPGHWNSASQYDADGDETHFWWNLPPWVVVELAEEDAGGVPLWPDAVRAEAWSGPVVTLTVNGSAIDTWTVTGDGHYTFELPSIDIEVGDIVTLSDSVDTKTITVEPLMIDQINFNGDSPPNTVFGTAASEREVRVEASASVGGWWAERWVNADTSGSFTADFGNPGNGWHEQWTADFGGAEGLGRHMRVEIYDPDNDRVETRTCEGVPRLEVMRSDGRVDAYDFPEGATVTLEITGASDPFTAISQRNPDNPCETIATFDLGDFEIPEAATVTASDDVGTPLVTHTVITFTIDIVDPEADTISGTAPADARVLVEADGNWRYIYADVTGHWIADFTVSGDEPGEEQVVDLVPGSSGRAIVLDEQGNTTELSWHISFANFQVDPTSKSVWGNDFEPNGLVTVAVDSIEAPGSPFGTDEWGNFNAGFDPATLDLQPGDLVVLDDGATTKDHTITNLTVGDVNADTDTVSGTADTGSEVCLDVWNWGQDCTTATDGTWSFTSDPNGWYFELEPGSGGAASQNDNDGDATQIHWNVASLPWVTGDADNDQIWGGGDWSLETPIMITIDDPATVAVPDVTTIAAMEPTDWDPSRHEFNVYVGDDIDLRPGFKIVASDPGYTKTLTLTALAITAVDLESDVVSGLADDGSDVYIDGGNDEENDWAFRLVAPTGGSFSANFGVPGPGDNEQSTVDLVPGSRGTAQQYDDDGDYTHASWSVEEPRFPTFSVRLESNEVHGYDWPPATLVTLTIDDPNTPESPDYTDGRVSEPAEWDPEQSFVWFGDLEFEMLPGFYVDMSDGATTKTHTVAKLALTEIDPDANTVSGKGDPGAEIGVEINGGPHADAVVGPSGNWTADFSGIHDIVERTEGWATDPDDDGDATQLDWRLPGPPAFSVTATHDWIEGFDFDGDLITFTIDDNDDENDGVLYEATIDIDPNSSNWLHVIDDFDIEAGQYVTVTDGFTTKATVVSPIRITDVDTQNWIVSGVADPNVEIDTFGLHPEIGGFGEHIVQVDANGDWELNLDDVIDPNQRPPEIPDGTVLGGGQLDADADRTVMFWDPAFVEGYVLVDGNPAQPVAGAEVFFQSTVGSTYTCTDESGYYSFDDASVVLMLVRGGIAATGRAVSQDAGCSNPDFRADDGGPLVTAFEFGPFDLQDGYEYIQFDVERAAAYQDVFVWHDQDGTWVPADGVQVRVFDRNDPDFVDAHGTDPDPSLYEQIFHEGMGQIATDFTVAYLLEEPGTVEMRYPYLTDLLVLVEYVDGSILGHQADAGEFVGDATGVYSGPTLVFPPPQVVADPFRELIQVRSFPIGGEITLTIVDGPELTAIVDRGETVFDLFAMEPWFDLDTGDVITVTYDDFDSATDDNAYSRELVVAPLGVQLVEDVEDVIHGTSEPGRTVMVSANTNESGSDRHLVADGNGGWTADFGDPELGEPVDIDKTVMWQLFIAVPDEDGDATVYETPMATPGLSALPELGTIGSEGSGLGPITISIPEFGYEVTGEPTHEPGPIVIGDFEFDPLTAGSELYTYGFGVDVTGLHDLTSGTVIHSSYVLWEMTLTVMDVTVGEVDTVADTVSGWVERPGIVATFVVPEPMSLGVIEPLETNEWTLTPFDVVDDEFADPRDITSVDVGLVLAGDSPGDSFDIYTQVLWDLKPHITALDLPVDPVKVDMPVDLSATFSDIEVPDTHDAQIDWGDGIVSYKFEIGKDFAANHLYSEPGIYTVELTVTDQFGNTDAAAHQYVVVYDPDGGFVTGGGWIDSPAGAYAPNPTLTGRASFGFVSKYKKGKVLPDGNANFQFQTGNLHFNSASFDWLVITGGDKAKFKGVGTINGLGDYGFMITAVDNPAGDTFRIKIWDRETGEIVYDNEGGVADDRYDATLLGGGSIVVHNGK